MTGTVAIAGNMILDTIKFIDEYPSMLELDVYKRQSIHSNR